MIGYLRGKIIANNDSELILDVNGVGYRVMVGEFFEESDEEIELFIYTSVSERAIDLFGFKETADLEVFELLLNVSGIGPKKAMGILSTVSGQVLLTYISMDQPEKLAAAGISKKTAEKIVVELKAKVSKLNIATGKSENINDIDKIVYLDVIEALSGLGYKKLEIDNALKQVDMDQFEQTEKLIKHLLNLLR